jgi:ABC-type multidrug transport system ATPase subunit
MRQRVGIAQALLNDPRVLIVDEPTVGLDPEERLRFRHLIADLSGDRIVILSTHIVSDLEATASRIAIIERGRLLRVETPETLLAQCEGRVFDWLVPVERLPELRTRHLIGSTLRRGDGIQVRVIAEASPDPAAQPRAASLEDAYLYAKARAAAPA